MLACGAFIRRFRADNDMSAVSALPYFYAALLENSRAFDVRKEFAVSLLVMFFDGGNKPEFLREFC